MSALLSTSTCHSVICRVDLAIAVVRTAYEPAFYSNTTCSNFRAPSPRSSQSVRCSPGPGWVITNSSSVTQRLERTGVLSAEATCDIEDTDSFAGHSAGDDIEYTVVLRNDGTTTLTMLEVTAGLLLPERYGRRSGRLE